MILLHLKDNNIIYTPPIFSTGGRIERIVVTSISRLNSYTVSELS